MPFQIGNTINLGKKYSQERIEKIRKALSGRIMSQEQRAKVSAGRKGVNLKDSGRKGKPLSEAHRAAIGRANIGLTKGRRHAPRTESEKRSISEKLKGIKRSPETIAKMRAAACLRRMSKRSFDTKPERTVFEVARLIFPELRRQREVPGARGGWGLLAWVCLSWGPFKISEGRRG